MPVSNRPSPKEVDEVMSSLDVIKLLLAKGAEVNLQLKNGQPYRTKLDRGTDGMLGAGTTPLIRAAKAADHVAMKLLLEKGADPKLATRNGVTALMAAAGVGTNDADTTGRVKPQADIIESIKLCLAAGVDINAVDSNGRTGSLRRRPARLRQGRPVPRRERREGRCQRPQRPDRPRCRLRSCRRRRLRRQLRSGNAATIEVLKKLMR